MTPSTSASRALSRLIRDPWIILAILLALVLAFLIVFPQVWIGRASLTKPNSSDYTVENFVKFFTTFRFRRALTNSIVISLATALGACLVAVPLAFLLARYEVPGKSTVLTLVTMATVSPPFLGAYAWVMLLGRSGILMVTLRKAGIHLPFRSIMGPGGIVWVGVWITYALVFLLVYDAFSNLDPSLEEAAMSVGANRWRTYVQISLPLVTPALLTGAYMSLMAAFADFGTPMLIGGGFPVLPVAVYYEFLSEVRANPSMASAASMVMIGTSTTVLLLQRYLVSRRSYAVVGARRQTLGRLPSWQQALLMIYTGLVLLMSFTPHIVVLVSSFLTWRYGLVKWRFTLDNYVQLLGRSLSPIYISYFLSVMATLLDIIVGVLVAYIIVRKSYQVLAPTLNTIVMIPYIVPGTVLAIGLILVFNKRPLLLTGTWVILCLSYFIRKLPYSMKAAEAAFYQVHPSLEEAAMSVGASSTRAFRDITARLILPAIVSGGTMSFLTIITELSSTIMKYSAPWITMTVVIFRNAMDPGSPFGVASAMTVILMISIYIPLYLVRRRFQVQAAL